MTPHTEAVDANGGFYTVREAARLLKIDKPERIVRWLDPMASGAAPVVKRSYDKVGRLHELSFLDLMEIRFVDHFRAAEISLQSLRVAAKNARRELGVSHPFATSSVKFQSDRKQIFLDTAKETGDRLLLNLMTNQLAIYEFIEQSFEKGLEFDVSGLARRWRPAPETAPRVIVSPVYAFGQPVISDRYVPTATIVHTWRANDGDLGLVAEWHSISKSDAEQAIEFELRTLH
jgi:uncharacterized protein (DUF433 family)